MHSLKIVIRIGATIGALLATALPAFAQPVYPPPIEVGPEVVTQGGAVGAPGVGPAVETASQGGGLAFTGAEIALLVVAAAVLATIGALALVAARRRAAQTAPAA
jgi:hypothetical protein